MNQTVLNAEEDKLVEIFRALSNPIRVQILRYIAGYPQCITGALVDFSNLAQSTISQHLKVLRDVDLICGTVDGPATCYSLNLNTLQWLKSQTNELTQGLVVTCCSGDDNTDLDSAGLNPDRRSVSKADKDRPSQTST